MKEQKNAFDIVNQNLKLKYPSSTFDGKNIIASSAEIIDSEIISCEIGENVKIFSSKIFHTKVKDNVVLGNFEGEFPSEVNIQKKIFGTDGIRGIFNQDFFNKQLVKQLAKVLCLDYPPKIVIGLDTRPDSKKINKILCEELKKYGAEILHIEVAPTPAVVFYAKQNFADYAIAITASHNPAIFSGIKIFGKNGKKLNIQEKLKIENNLIKNIKINKNIKKINKKILNLNNYFNFIKSIDNNLFNNIKIVLDCANGSASKIAPKIFEELHAEVVAINTSGEINKNCGALYPEKLVREVLKNKADLGFAFDGDADRIIAVNNKGKILNGDDILYLLAWYGQKQNLLTSNIVVGTIMTNQGIENKLKALGLDLLRTPVGDKYIQEEMAKYNYCLGGEQTGHIIINKYINTSEGLLTARILASIYLENKNIFDSVKENKYIQINKDINLINQLPNNFFQSEEFLSLTKLYQNKLSANGRFVIRPSGTENKLRIMVETTDKNTSLIYALDIKKRISKLIKNYIFK